MELSGCPHCQGSLAIRAKRCLECGLEIHGDFLENPLVYLSRPEQDFLFQFILCAGNFKALGEKLDLTYPTLRSRLDRIIARLEEIEAEHAPDEILDQVSRKTMTPEEAIKRLKGMSDRKRESA